MGKAFGAPEQAKIKQIVAEGMTVMQEIQDLTEGLNETIKAVAEELEVKPSVIKKAINNLVIVGNYIYFNTETQFVKLGINDCINSIPSQDINH